MERPLETIIKVEENSESIGQPGDEKWKCGVCGDEFRAGYNH